MTATPPTPAETAVVAPSAAAASRAKDGLRERAARQRQRQNRLAVALALVLGVGSVAVYLPQRQAIAETRLTLARTEAELASNRDRAAMLPQLVAAVGSLRRQVDQFKPLRGRSDLERAIHEISAINTSTQLANYKYVWDPERVRSMFHEQALKITFDADFVDAMSFIQKIEAMDRLTRVRELSIEKRDGTAVGDVSVTMSLSLFFDPTVEEAK